MKTQHTLSAEQRIDIRNVLMGIVCEAGNTGLLHPVLHRKMEELVAQAVSEERKSVCSEILYAYKKNTGIDDDVFTRFLETMSDLIMDNVTPPSPERKNDKTEL